MRLTCFGDFSWNDLSDNCVVIANVLLKYVLDQQMELVKLKVKTVKPPLPFEPCPKFVYFHAINIVTLVLQMCEEDRFPCPRTFSVSEQAFLPC